MDNKFAPVVIFTFNRPDHLTKLVDSLKANKECSKTDLIVFCDGAKNGKQDIDNQNVIQIINNISGFAIVNKIFRETNYGLARNIIEGLNWVFAEYETAIVLEDDLLVSPYFLSYMNRAFDYYSDKNVFSIAGYSPRVQFPSDYQYTTFSVMRNCSWGWGTWRNRWNQTDFDVKDFAEFISDKNQRRAFNKAGSDLWPMLLKQQCGEINSWSIRFCYSAFKASMPTIYPTKSYIENNGADGSGTNVKSTSRYVTALCDKPIEQVFCPPQESCSEIISSFKRTYDCSLIRQLINYIKLQKYLITR